MNTLRTPAETADLRYRRIMKKITGFLKRHLYLILSAVAAATLIGSNISNWNGAYFDADGYMRANRVWHWLINPSFSEQPVPESNYPFGEILHWTRPMDILWLFNTIPFLWLNNLKEAVFMGGVFLAPWLQIISVIALAYGLRRHFNIYLTLFGCIIFLLDPIMMNYYAVGRPDHHALMALLGTYAVSLNLCWLKKRHNRYLRLLGLTLALATFTAIEGLVLYVLFLGFLLSLYIFLNISLMPAVKTSKYFAFALTAFWLLNPPYEGWFYPDNGRISVLFVTFAWFTFAALYGIELGHLHTRPLKIWCLICAILGIALMLAVCFGADIYLFPLESKIRNIWSNRIAEMKPVWKQSWDKIFAVYSFAFCSLLLCLKLLPVKPYRRIMLLNFCLALPLFALNLLALRFANYQCLYNILPWLCLTDKIYRRSAFAHRKSNEFPESVWAVILGILLLQTIVYLPTTVISLQKEKKAQYSSLLCRQIQNIGGTLVTDNFLSPKYIWNCNVTTVGTPYHRNRDGLTDNHNILYSTSDSTLIPLLLKHQVRQILLFANSDKYYNMSGKNKEFLYYRLIKRENIPAFLEEVPSSIENARLYRLKI